MSFFASWGRTKGRLSEIIHMKNNDKGEQICEIWKGV